MRFRDTFITIGSILVILIWTLSDPDSGLIQHLEFGAGTVATLVILLKSILYVGMLHFSRKALLDYLDLGDAIKKALETADGAGKVVIGVGLIMISISIVILTATSH